MNGPKLESSQKWAWAEAERGPCVNQAGERTGAFIEASAVPGVLMGADLHIGESSVRGTSRDAFRADRFL